MFSDMSGHFCVIVVLEAKRVCAIVSLKAERVLSMASKPSAYHYDGLLVHNYEVKAVLTVPSRVVYASER